MLLKANAEGCSGCTCDAELHHAVTCNTVVKCVDSCGGHCWIGQGSKELEPIVIPVTCTRDGSRTDRKEEWVYCVIDSCGPGVKLPESFKIVESEPVITQRAPGHDWGPWVWTRYASVTNLYNVATLNNAKALNNVKILNTATTLNNVESNVSNWEKLYEDIENDWTNTQDFNKLVNYETDKWIDLNDKFLYIQTSDSIQDIDSSFFKDKAVILQKQYPDENIYLRKFYFKEGNDMIVWLLVAGEL